MERVVILNYGCATPLGIGSELGTDCEFQDNTLAHISGIVLIPPELKQNIPVSRKGSDMKTYAPVKTQDQSGVLQVLDDNSLTEKLRKLGEREVRGRVADKAEVKDIVKKISKIHGNCDRYHKLSFIAAALAAQGLELDSGKDGLRAGISWGSGMGGLQSFEDGTIKISNKERPSLLYIPNSIANIITPLNYLVGAFGPTDVTETACASGMHAIYRAFKDLNTQYDGLDWMLAGGADAVTTLTALAGFGVMGAISSKEDCSQASIPFAAERDGFVLGEGAVSFILATDSYASGVGADPLAEIVSGAATHDANPEITSPNPDGLGLYNAMHLALKRGDVSPDQVDLFVTHGTSTGLGDIAEWRAIRKLYENSKKIPVITSNKGWLGHTIGASGPANILTALMAMNGYITGSTAKAIDPMFTDVDLVESDGRNSDSVRYVLVNAAGFGGLNCSLLLKRYEP